ncbi:hypothetical protein OHJ28_01255 [Dickeya fangzhongdai]|uniref:hypothetical protein n=1 Tax=Dickeya fangzhongdai TaxID=1778540 RepID=UPI0023E455AC|nr:hypothetical protein [Dickeya fangzhongdai]WES91295.1 hypothetical protein PQ617_08175 [Dickeya fangzhongdai]
MSIKAEARDTSNRRSKLASYSHSVIEEQPGSSDENRQKRLLKNYPPLTIRNCLLVPNRPMISLMAAVRIHLKGYLALIAYYDDSNTFTVNKRRAALHESNEQESAWSHWIVAKSKQEWSQGEFKQTEFFKLVLEHTANRTGAGSRQLQVTTQSSDRNG